MIGEHLFVDYYQRDQPYKRSVFVCKTPNPHLQDGIYFHHMVFIVVAENDHMHITSRKAELT